MTTVEPDYVEDRVFCPNDHPNRPGERTCTYCSAELAPAPEKPVRPRPGLSVERAVDLVVRKHGETLQSFDATPERPLRRHLDDRSEEPDTTEPEAQP